MSTEIKNFQTFFILFLMAIANQITETFGYIKFKHEPIDTA